MIVPSLPPALPTAGGRGVIRLALIIIRLAPITFRHKKFMIRPRRMAIGALVFTIRPLPMMIRL